MKPSICRCQGSCPVRVWVSVWVRVWFATRFVSGSSTVRVRFVSGFVSGLVSVLASGSRPGSCLVRDWASLGSRLVRERVCVWFVSGSCAVRVWVRVRVSVWVRDRCLGSSPVRVWFVSGFLGSRLVRDRVRVWVLVWFVSGSCLV